MRRLGTILGHGRLTTVVILMGMAACITLFQYGRAWPVESEAYGRMAVSEIATTWNPRELLQRASPELFEKVREDAIPDLMKESAEAFGPLKTITRVTGVSSWGFRSGSFRVESMVEVHARFHKRAGVVRCLLVKKAGEWRIAGLRVDSEDSGAEK